MPRQSEPHSSWFMNPPPMALRSLSRSRMISKSRGPDQTPPSTSSRTSVRPTCSNSQARSIQLLRVMPSSEAYRPKLHIKAGNLKAEGPSRRNDVARAVSIPMESWPKMTRRQTACRVTAVRQSIGLFAVAGSSGGSDCVGPGAHVDVNEPAMRERAVRHMRQGDARLRPLFHMSSGASHPGTG